MNTLVLPDTYLIQSHEVLPEALVHLPEFTHIRKAIRHSERGIRITGETLNEVSRLMLQLPYLDRLKRLMYFYEIMHLIGRGDTFSYLASESYVRSKFETTNTRIGRIHEYMMKNYHEEINLEEIAGIVHMAPSSVCRFFKSSTGMTIFEYLNKIKIDYSCQLLLNSDRSVVNISYDCGFNNLSHFNKQFKKFIGKTPSQFRKLRLNHNTH